MMLAGLPGVVIRFSAPVGLSRPGAATYDAAGVASWAASTTSSILAYVERPARAGDLMTLPEGDRISRTCTVWSTTELRHRDRLTVSDGEVYEVRGSEPWVQVSGFYRAVGVKVQP